MDYLRLPLLFILSVELHCPGHHGGADFHQFPAAVLRLRDQPACSHPAAAALWVMIRDTDRLCVTIF